MGNFSLNEIIRYTIIGIVALLYLFIISEDTYLSISQKLDNTGLLIISLTFGVLFYNFYRTIFYNFIILKFKDLVFRKNYRSLLRDRLSKVQKDITSLSYGSFEIEIFWHSIRNKCLREESNKLQHIFSSTHLCYQISLISFLALIPVIFVPNDQKCCMVLIFLLISISFFILALITDNIAEKYEKIMLMSLLNNKDSKIDEYIGQILS